MPIQGIFPSGDSAYQRAVAQGFSGTEQEFYQQLAKAKDIVTVTGGAELLMDEQITNDHYQIEFTEEDETGITPDDIFAAKKDLSNILDGSLAQAGALLALAAAAAYNPSGVYATGDYCTNNGNLYKCLTAIPDGEAWTAEHWTETSVAAELAEMHSLLAPLGGATTPQAVLVALGAGVQDNDLINPFFEINQRGVTEWTGGYGVDGWLNTENKDTAKITVGSDGEITLTSTVSKEELGCVFSQVLEKLKPGAIKTMSFMGSVISGTAWLQLANDTKQDYTCQSLLPILNDSIFSYTFQIPPEWNETDKVRYTIYQTGPGVVKIKAAKKEPGDKQTLGYKDSDGAWHLFPQPESDYATQLAKCQRYFRRFPANYAMGVLQDENNAKNACFRYECNPPMRTTPVLLMQNQSDLTDAIDDGKSAITPTKVVLGWRSNENVIGFYFEGASGNGGPGFVCNRYIDASAEL